jgi:hypothetical protein
VDPDVSKKYVTFLFNALNAELNPICHLLALLGAHPIFHISRISVNGSRPRKFESSKYNETLKKDVTLPIDTSETTCQAMQRHIQADRN